MAIAVLAVYGIIYVHSASSLGIRWDGQKGPTAISNRIKEAAK
jgi:hypothetical protein